MNGWRGELVEAFGAAWGMELLKLRRSTVARLTTPLLIGLVPAGAIGAVALARSPQLPGAAAAKFLPFATGDLAATHLLVAGQVLSVAVLTAGGFAAAWSYGREFTEGSAGALAGLTTPRWMVGLVKALLLVGWLIACLMTSIAVAILLSLAVGGQLDGATWQSAGTAGLAGLLAVALVLPFAWVATVTRSPLGTIGVLIAVVMVTQIIVVLGAGTWFPYAVPSLLTGMGGSEVVAEIGPGSLLVTAGLAPLAVAAVARQWQRLNGI